MIPLVLLIAVFICIASIFFPGLRQLAKAILVTAAMVVGGLYVLVQIVSH